jgi:glycolate oxidase FAD binding subunit
MDLIPQAVEDFAAEVGPSDPVSIVGSGTRTDGPIRGRTVSAPTGIYDFQPAEMTLRCGAGTLLDEVHAELARAGQCVSLPAGGTVGGALADGASSVLRLGRGPTRDALLQARYVSSEGRLVKAGGPTVKNVTGFDLCRLLVGSRGTLGFMAEAILRTKPLPAESRWFCVPSGDPWSLLRALYKPSAVLWDGADVWLCLEGHAGDIRSRLELVPAAVEVAGPPPLPAGSRRSVAPSGLSTIVGGFVAEIGVGIVHHVDPWLDPPAPSAAVVALTRRLKETFDPTGRLNPGVDVLERREMS